MKTLIYGGKFNPLHKGHKSLVVEVCKKFNFDKVIFMPTRLEKSQICISENIRIKTIKNFAKKNNFEFSNLELSKEKYNPTIKTLQELKKSSNDELFFLIGSDQLENFHTWDNADELSKYAKFIVALRKGYKINKKLAKKYDMKIVEVDIDDISSTQIRKGNIDGICYDDKNLIINDIDFLKTILKNNVDKKRYKHSLNTAITARKLAKKFLSGKEKEAYIAGLLHDIAKNWNKDKLKSYAKTHNLMQEDSKTWHQWAGANFVKDLGLSNEITSSIQNHTTANFEMSIFDKIIFCADKISQEREYEEVASLRKVCKINIDQCFVEAFQASITFLYKNKISLSKRTKQLEKRWLDV